LGEPVLKTHSLTRAFGSLIAVDRLSIEVLGGEVFGLLGPNGAGKTTTIKMLTTLLPPSAGSAWVAGCDVVRQPTATRRAIGYVPQLISVDAQVTGYENLWVFARLYRIPRDERDRRIRESLDFMGLSAYADVLVKNYSGGMIRRLEIAQAMMHRPQVLFMDEPTVGLDPLARDAVWEQIDLVRKTYGTSVVLTTHYMEEADRLCDRVGILHRGKLQALDSPSALKESLNSPGATLEDVFLHFAGEELELAGNYRETGRTRRAAVRLE
jgi:ABC-2 type transport system ATP-binding protein